MAPTDPPDVPKLPPVRGSAESVVPPHADDAPSRGWEEAADVVAPATEPAGESMQRERRQRPKTTDRPRHDVVAREAPGGRRSNRTEDGRRYSSAGNGLVVALLALFFGALLNAPGMHKTSFNKQPGTGRDVALAITGGLAGVSGALQLDRPRQAVQGVAGREDADVIDVTVVIPPEQGTPATKPAVTPGKVTFSPEKKLRIWVAGDSLVVVPGYSIVRASGASPAIDSVGGIDAHIATGLTRPDVFNWFAEIRTKMRELRPHVVVLNFGGNDDKAYMTGLPEGTTIGDFGGPTWSKEYRRRVAGIMSTINRAGATVVWIGLPITGSEEQTQRYDVINAIVQKEAKARPGRAIFVDTYTMFAGDTGGFTEYLENAKGETVKVRAGDGVHFDTEGGDIIAREVLRQLNMTFDLTSWRRAPS